MSESETVALDEEAKRLKLEEIKSSARKGIAQNQRDTMAAHLPASDLKPLEGKVDVGTGVGLVGRLLAHELLQDEASTIVDAIQGKLTNLSKVLIVEDRALVATDWTYSIILAELEAQEGALLAAIKAFDANEGDQGSGTEEEGDMLLSAAAVAAIPAIAGAVAGLIGMFRSNYSITGQEFAIGATPLVAAVANRLLALAPAPEVTVDQFSLLGDRIITRFQGALKNRLTLDRLTQTARGKVQPADRHLEDLRTVFAAYVKALGEAKTESHTTALGESIDKLRSEIAQAEKTGAHDRARVMLAEAVSARFDAFVNEVTTTPKDGGYPPLVRAAMRERLHADTGQHTHVLFVGVEASGGEMITRQSYFAKSGVAVVMGGAQVSYLLLDVASNKTVAAGSKSLLGHLKYDLKNGYAGFLSRADLTTPPPSNGKGSKSLLARIVGGL